MTKLSADQKRFHEATKNDNIAILRDIINKFVNTKDEEGKTPLQNSESEEIMFHRHSRAPSRDSGGIYY